MHGRRVFIIEAKRSAIGKFLGSLYEADPVDVCTQVIQGGNFHCKDVQNVIVGNVISAGMGQGIARKIAMTAGIPEEIPAYSVNMVCGSGMQAIYNGVNDIMCGLELVLCGGLEFMSNIPFATQSYIRFGKRFGDFTMTDLMTHDGLTDSFSKVHMGITAENIARKYHISREEQEEYSYFSQQRAIKAVDERKFVDEIVAVWLKNYKGQEFCFDTDEFPNRDTCLEKLKSLKPTFIKDGTGTITAGTSSGINDGVAFLALASETYCTEKEIVPMAEIVDVVTVGCNPQYMGLGPYYAIKKLLDKTGIPFNTIDVFEINEAFAAQVLGCYRLLAKEYNVCEDEIIKKCNIYGSGLGLGHPLGASGARITTTLAHILAKNTMKYGIASLCIGGGMGAALLLKKVNKDGSAGR